MAEEFGSDNELGNDILAIEQIQLLVGIEDCIISSRMDPIRTQNEASFIVKNHLTEHQEDSLPLSLLSQKERKKEMKRC